MKPSKRIKEIFNKIKHPNVAADHFCTEVDAVIQYLDENWEVKQAIKIIKSIAKSVVPSKEDVCKECGDNQ